MVDLDADLVAPDLDSAFDEIPQIDGINDFSLEQIIGANTVRLAQMNRNILRSYAQNELLAF